MAEPYDYTQEDHVREVERVLMYIAQAHRKAKEVAAELEKEGAEERFVVGLKTAASALWAEHNRLLNTTHFPVPDQPAPPQVVDGGRTLLDTDDEDDPPAPDQQRMAI